MSADSDRKRPYRLPICVALIGLLAGASIGGAVGIHAAQLLAAALRQSGTTCGMGVVFLPFGYALIGMGVGAMPAVILAAIAYLSGPPRRKSDWAAYYGG